jgi:hypothetical protein
MATPGRLLTGPHRVRVMRWVRHTVIRARPATPTRQDQLGVTSRRAKPSRSPPMAMPARRVVAPLRAPSMATSRTQPTTAPTHVTRFLVTTPFFIPGCQISGPQLPGRLAAEPGPLGRTPAERLCKTAAHISRAQLLCTKPVTRGRDFVRSRIKVQPELWGGLGVKNGPGPRAAAKKDPKHATALRITRTPGESGCFLAPTRNEQSHSMAIV